MVKKLVLLAFLAAPFLAAGCSNSDDTTGGGGGGGTIVTPAGCNTDTTLSCAGGSTGFACDIGSNPEDEDSSLSSSDTGTGESDFCCVYAGTGVTGGDDTGGGPAPTGCNVDTTLDCSGNSIGYACDEGDNPEAEDDSLSCSDPALAAGEDDYCCFTGFTGSSTTCTPDDDVTLACDTGYGFSCAEGDDPTTYDSSLNCSDSTDTEDGESLFCCTYD